MKKFELLRELGKYPVFNLKIASDIIKKSREYTKLVVYRLKKDGLIYEIEKNKYAMNKDIFTIASNIVWPSYISFWTALSHYHLTEQIPHVIFVITTRRKRRKEIVVGNNKIIFVVVKPKYFFGYIKERYDNYDIFIAEKEKALLDSALFKKVSFSEISEMIGDGITDINVDLLIEYLLKIQNKALIKRFGFLLEKHDVDRHNSLKKFIDYKYVPLDYSFQAKGKKNVKWRIIENVKL